MRNQFMKWMMASLLLPLMGLAGMAHAMPWHADYDTVQLMNGTNSSHTWTWDITTDEFNPGVDVITGYQITLYFSDDDHDPVWAPWEIASFDQPGVLGDLLLFDVTDGPLGIGASIAGVLSLNANGLLTATLTRVVGDFYFFGGDLVAYGVVGEVGVPEPAGLVLLGIGALGAGVARSAALARRRRLVPLS